MIIYLACAFLILIILGGLCFLWGANFMLNEAHHNRDVLIRFFSKILEHPVKSSHKIKVVDWEWFERFYENYRIYLQSKPHWDALKKTEVK